MHVFADIYLKICTRCGNNIALIEETIVSREV